MPFNDFCSKYTLLYFKYSWTHERHREQYIYCCIKFEFKLHFKADINSNYRKLLNDVTLLALHYINGNTKQCIRYSLANQIFFLFRSWLLQLKIKKLYFVNPTFIVAQIHVLQGTQAISSHQFIKRYQCSLHQQQLVLINNTLGNILYGKSRKK